MLHELTCTEFDNWAFLFSERLYTHELDEVGIGQLTAAIYNASRNFKTTMNANKMIPKRHRKKSIKEQIAMWKVIADAGNTKDNS